MTRSYRGIMPFTRAKISNLLKSTLEFRLPHILLFVDRWPEGERYSDGTLLVCWPWPTNNIVILGLTLDRKLFSSILTYHVYKNKSTWRVRIFQLRTTVDSEFYWFQTNYVTSNRLLIIKCIVFKFTIPLWHIYPRIQQTRTLKSLNVNKF